MLNSLNGPMLQQATDELKNMQFEMDMLRRSVQKSNSLQLTVHEPVGHEV